MAEIVLRPPDIRHLDAAFQAVAGSPRGQTGLKTWIGGLFTSRCATCGRIVVVDEFIWEGADEDADRLTGGRLSRKHYRCLACREQAGGSEQRTAVVDDEDLERAAADIPDDTSREIVRERFPVPAGAAPLVEELLDLQTARQLAGLTAILERIESDLRAAPVEAVLRLTLLHALLPASRLNSFPGRTAALRIVGGQVRRPSGAQWRERNPWVAFEDGYRVVRAFLQHLESAGSGPMPGRFGDDLRALADRSANVVLRLGTPSSWKSLALEAREFAAAPSRPRLRLVLSQPPQRPNVERLSWGLYGTAWVLGREAASLVPIEPLLESHGRPPWDWQSAALRRSLQAIAPVLDPDARVVLLTESGTGAEGLAAAVLGGVGAGLRLTTAHLEEADAEIGGVVELAPAGAPRAGGPRTRANQALPPLPGGAGDADVVPGRGIFAPPERIDQRPFDPAEASRAVTEVAVEVLKARGEPTGTDRLLGEVLVGLDRSGHLRRLVAGPGSRWSSIVTGTSEPVSPGNGGSAPSGATESPQPSGPPDGLGLFDLLDTGATRGSVRAAGTARGGIPSLSGEAAGSDQVERLLALVRDELERPTQRRIAQIEPGRWWLVDRVDRDAAAVPLSDRVEWAVFSLLSTAGPISEAAFVERIAGMYRGHDLPDEELVRACLASYRSPASTPDRITTTDELLRRSQEHSELLALIADTGHRIGLSVWLSGRELARRVGGRPLGERLDRRELGFHLPLIARAPADALADVDAIWYQRGKLTVFFEVEWTAMVGDSVLRRHGRIPGDEHTIRLLVIAPERTELLRFKIERSPVLRQALEEGNWHVIKSNHLRAFTELEQPRLDDLEPFLGLDPLVDRGGEQMRLFGG